MGLIDGDFVRRPRPPPGSETCDRDRLNRFDRESNQHMSDRETWLHEKDNLKFELGIGLSDDDPKFWL